VTGRRIEETNIWTRCKLSIGSLAQYEGKTRGEFNLLFIAPFILYKNHFFFFIISILDS